MRALPHQIYLGTNGVPVGTIYTYVAPHPTEAMEAPGYFNPVQNHVGKFDKIEAYSVEPNGNFSMALFMVMHSEPNCVITRRYTRWEEFRIDVGELILLDRGDGKFDVKDATNGRTVHKGVDAPIAHAVVKAEHSKPIEEWSIPDLQKEMKRLTGSGFPPGKYNQVEMVELVRGAREAA